MTPSKVSSADDPSATWNSLVARSIEASTKLAADSGTTDNQYIFDSLQSYKCLDAFLCGAPRDLMFWFFQRREVFLAQNTMTKWSRNNLDDYVLLPAAFGFVSRRECFFVSHFWRTQGNPDPGGEYLRLHRAELRPQDWSYIWVDWTCIPQAPHSPAEELYFRRSLETISGVIRNSGFAWYYPPFEARLWILYEIAEYTLTSTGGITPTSDIKQYQDHVQEMLQTNVRSVLDKYSYKCTQDRDKDFLTAWLDLLVLLHKLKIHIDDIRSLMDHLTWGPALKVVIHNTVYGTGLILEKFEGNIFYGGNHYMFNPFPRWGDGKYSTR